MELESDLQELSTVEEFLEYFEVEYEPRTAMVNRLHILQRYHDYLEGAALPEDEEARRALYAERLTQAYQDFVTGSALTEKVFKVFRDQEEKQKREIVPLQRLTRSSRSEAEAASGEPAP